MEHIKQRIDISSHKTDNLFTETDVDIMADLISKRSQVCIYNLSLIHEMYAGSFSKILFLKFFVLCNYLELDHVTGDQFADDLEDERHYDSAERSGLVLQ